MACTITIVSITGFTDDAGLPPHRLEVTGTASDCSTVIVKVTRQNTGATTEEVIAEVDQGGAWTAVFEASSGHFTTGDFACAAQSDKIEVVVVCKDDPACGARRVFDGLGCVGGRDCPVITGLTATPGACNPDGTRDVTVSATVAPGSVTPVFVHWRHGSEEGASDFFTEAGTFTDTHPYAAGQQSFAVVVTYPEGCTEAAGTILVEACPPPATTAVCPSIAFAAPVMGDCNKGNERNVTLTATLTLSPAGPVTADLVRLDAAGTVVATIASGQSANGTLALSGVGSFPAGTQSATVRVTSPAGCGGATIPITVEACPVPCPAVSFDAATVGDCDADGRRRVRVRAHLAPQGAGSFGGRLVLWDTLAQVPLEELDSAESFGPEITLSVDRDFPPGTHVFVTQVTAPPGCIGASQSVTVASCGPMDDDDDDDDDDDNDDNETNGRFSINWCAVALFTLLGMLVVGALALGIGICVLGVVASGPVAVVAAVIAIIGAVLLIVATIGLLVWLYVCGSCRANCFLLDVLIDALAVLAGAAIVLTIIGAVIAALGLSALCWLGWLIDLADFGFLFLVAYWWARVVGCRPWPRWVPDWARWQLPDAWRVTCRRR